jgi:hypothetical protein
MAKLLDGPWMILLLVSLLAWVLLGGGQHFTMPNLGGQGGGYTQSHHSHHSDR